MQKNYENCVLNIMNGINGEVFTLHDFFKLPSYTQEEILGDIILPMIYDFEKINITIGSKN